MVRKEGKSSCKKILVDNKNCCSIRRLASVGKLVAINCFALGGVESGTEDNARSMAFGPHRPSPSRALQRILVVDNSPGA